ncbi:glutamine synthetase family protein [Phycicoccus sp.]|uniref:glutamine synthetase family protein n=1 Tax=Phycicoccus sp. TaxID=1902410 RepID=UPI002D1D78EF|nr:glutamine synthetase family protein [Phycicoccus sp.]HMM94046.1 glutamine synthetase family protein [Phycicoccus sp.]
MANGEIGTIEVVLIDMQGRLQGKRAQGRHFVERVMSDGTEAQNYLLATDIEMNTVQGYELASWSSGYANLRMRPDLSSLRRLPWHPESLLVLCDLEDRDGVPLAMSPRQVLRNQLSQLEIHGWTALVGTELEFLVFRDSYEAAWSEGYRDLTRVSQYGIDYSMLDTRGTGGFLSRLIRSLEGAGVDIEGVLSEANLGQHELVLAFTDALRACDNHVVAKFGAKQVAASEGLSLTFMAKFDSNEGNSCHIHFSLRDLSGRPVFAGTGTHGFSDIMESFLAGQLAYLPELTLMFAPNVNSYKRFVEGSYAPTAISWGFDNRTCALRVVGSGASLRFEHRLPGGDVNPHLAVSAIVAAGLRGIGEKLSLAEPISGNAYASAMPTVPTNLREALRLFRESEVASAAFGAEVVNHYSRMAEVELEAFDRSVTDWEKFRGFERM